MCRNGNSSGSPNFAPLREKNETETLNFRCCTLQQSNTAYDQRFCCSIYVAINGVYAVCVSISTAIWDLDKLTFRLFYPSTLRFYMGYDGIFFSSIIWCICISNRANTECFASFFIYVFFEDKNDFLLFAHIVFMVMYLYFNWYTNTFLLSTFFSLKLFTFNRFSVCE